MGEKLFRYYVPMFRKERFKGYGEAEIVAHTPEEAVTMAEAQQDSFSSPIQIGDSEFDTASSDWKYDKAHCALEDIEWDELEPGELEELNEEPPFERRGEI